MKKLVAGIAIVGTLGIGGVLSSSPVNAGELCEGRRVELAVSNVFDTETIAECVRVKDLPTPTARQRGRDVVDNCPAGAGRVIFVYSYNHPTPFKWVGDCAGLT